MTRPLRIQYHRAVYHITCRRNEQKEIFRDIEDRKIFLQLLEEFLKTYNIKLYTYVLMNNHFHLLIETPLGNLSEFMRQFNISYTYYFNRKHQRVGHLYQGRYKSLLVDTDNYLIILSMYIHLNPVRIEEIKGKGFKYKEKYLKEYPWSSLIGYIDKSKEVPWVEYSVVLEQYKEDGKSARDAYWDEIQSILSIGTEDITKKIIGQSILGNQDFVRLVREKFLKDKKGIREIPAIRRLKGYKTLEEIMRIIKEETGKEEERILKGKGVIRQMAMEFLYTLGGLKGQQIGEIMGVDYSTVSQGRKRVKEQLKIDINLKEIFDRIELRLKDLSK